MSNYRGEPVALDVYHGVPAGWYAHEIVAEHARLVPIHDLVVPVATEPGAPSWLPERYEWLQYRAALYRVADGVAQGDPACTELAVRFIELRHIGSYSGFIREKLARRLRHATLTSDQVARLHRHFRGLVLNDERTHEFRAYVRLWRRIMSQAERADVLAEIGRVRGPHTAAWLEERLL